jgi:hypothetical protein
MPPVIRKAGGQPVHRFQISPGTGADFSSFLM